MLSERPSAPGRGLADDFHLNGVFADGDLDLVAAEEDKAMREGDVAAGAESALTIDVRNLNVAEGRLAGRAQGPGTLVWVHLASSRLVIG